MPTTHREGVTEDELVRSCLPLVQFIVSDVAASVPRSVVRDDLVSAALLGLAQAARSWDPERGVTFEHYARLRMRGAVLDELRGRDWASRSVRASARKVGAVSERLTAKLGRTPTPGEVADEAGISEAALCKITGDVHRATVVHYDAVYEDASKSELFMSPERSPSDVVVEQETNAHLRKAISSLPERLRHVVEGYFIQGRQMQEIADELGVTESRISQMRAEALDLMRDVMRAHLDPESAPAPATTGRVSRRKAAYHAAMAAAA